MAKRDLTPEQLHEREQISEQCRTWLNEQMKRTGWNATTVVKESGVSKQNISRVLKNQKSKKDVPPTFSRDTILKLARAFKSSETEALAAIGLMHDDGGASSLNAKKAADLIVKLPSERQPEALDLLQHFVSKYGRQKSAKKLAGEAAAPRARKARR